MSTVNRAFIRAYSKEIPLPELVAEETSAPVPNGGSPYAPLTYAPLSRQPAARYHVASSVIPWGSASVPPAPLEVASTPEPHMPFVPDVAMPVSYAQNSVQSASVKENPVAQGSWALPAMSPAAPLPLVLNPVPSPDVVSPWLNPFAGMLGNTPRHGQASHTEASQAVQQPAPPIEPITTAPLGAESKAEEQTEPIAQWESSTNFAQLPEAISLLIGEYLCVPGPGLTSDVHITLAPPAVEFIDGTQTLQARSTETTLAEPTPIVVPVAASVAAPVNPPVEMELEKAVEKAVPPIAETVRAELEVLWEVDRYLFPAMTDRLLRSYAYFSQAGEKLQQAAAAGLKTLAITGIGRGEGRTTLAICLARAAAKSGMRVGLLDCDFANPTLALQLGLEIDQGWEQAALGKISLPEIAIRSVEEGITLFPLCATNGSPALQLLEKRTVQTLRQAASYVDLLILDFGPWREPKLAREVQLPFDAAIVVRDCRQRSLEEVQPTAKMLQDAGVEAVGIAENFTAMS